MNPADRIGPIEPARDGRSRHLSLDALKNHLDSRMPMLIPVEGDPMLFWHLEAGGTRPTLRIPVPRGTKAPRLPTQGIRAVCVLDGPDQFLQVYGDRAESLREFHIVGCEIADRVQLGGSRPVVAVVETIAAWRRLLARKRSLTVEAELGLFGELLTLTGLAGRIGWAGAVGAWQHPDCLDHDFLVSGYDIEVKTSASRTRVHTVHGLGQLQPHPGRPLWFVSHVVEESDAGRSVLGLVWALRTLIRVDDPDALDEFDSRLAVRLGGDREVPRERRWVSTGPPLTVEVGEAFPRLTESVLHGLDPAVRERVLGVDYRIDVGDLASMDPPQGVGVHLDVIHALPPDVTAGWADPEAGS